MAEAMAHSFLKNTGEYREDESGAAAGAGR